MQGNRATPLNLIRAKIQKTALLLWQSVRILIRRRNDPAKHNCFATHLGFDMVMNGSGNRGNRFLWLLQCTVCQHGYWRAQHQWVDPTIFLWAGSLHIAVVRYALCAEAQHAGLVFPQGTSYHPYVEGETSSFSIPVSASTVVLFSTNFVFPYNRPNLRISRWNARRQLLRAFLKILKRFHLVVGHPGLSSRFASEMILISFMLTVTFSKGLIKLVLSVWRCPSAIRLRSVSVEVVASEDHIAHIPLQIREIRSLPPVAGN